jgi:hypothetical protein
MFIAIGFAAACGGDDAKDPATGYPPAGEDRFENTRATVQIEVAPEEASIARASGQELITIELEGPALIMRGDPQQDGDVFVVATEIVEMELRGDSELGPVIVRESANRESKGEVRQQGAGEDFPADSFFDVFVEVELPDLDLTLHNEEPMRMSTELHSLPPDDKEKYRGEDERPLFTPAGLQVGRIVDALHIPEPEADGDDDDPTEEPKATATAEAEATATESAPVATETSGPSGATTTAGCTHGTGQSVLHIIFVGLDPGENITGIISQRPQGGLISPENFAATADANGVARVNVDIARFGAYAWMARDGALRGNYIVGEVCPGEP